MVQDPPHAGPATQLSRPFTLNRYLNDKDQPWHGIDQVVRVPEQVLATRPATPPDSTMSSTGYIDMGNTGESEKGLDGRQIQNIVRTAFALALDLGATHKPENIKMGLDTMKMFEETFNSSQGVDLEEEERDKENRFGEDEADDAGPSEGGIGE